ncbi:MAG TPA: VOC family protein [Xanthobacteraceae bacterium]|nr:VOC family protein [Xanthobacteraceae bacterium]
MAMIENVTPILRVENLEASRRYYIQTLGFSLDWDTDGAISVSRDGKSIMLCEGEQGQPGTWLWIGVEDADALYAEFLAKGAHIRSPPQNFSWAYEFEVADLTAMFFALGLGRSLDRPTEISSLDLTSSLVPAIGVVSRPRLGG